MRFLILLSVTLTFSTFAFSEDQELPSHQVLEGSNFTTACNATEGPDVEVYWTLDGGGGEAVQTGRTLEFHHISRNESGNYTCHCVNASDPLQNATVETLNIDVIYPAEVTEFSVAPLIAFENQTFNITCDMEGHPNPDWMVRQNRTWNILFRGHYPGPVIITQVIARCGEGGVYLCTGLNELNQGVNASRGQSVDVMCSPRPKPLAPTPHWLTSGLGVTASFRENVIGFPAPTFVWTRDDGRPMGNVTTASGVEYAILNISNVRVSDFGNYTLTMSNKLGVYKESFHFQPYGPPQTPTNFHFSDVMNDRVRLFWTSGYDMGATQGFVVVRWEDNTPKTITPVLEGWYTDHGVGVRWNYTLKGLNNDTQYNLSVAAKCRTFTSGYSNYIVFNITDVAPTPTTPPKAHNHGLSHRAVVIMSVCLSVGVVVVGTVIVYAVYVRRCHRRNPYTKT